MIPAFKNWIDLNDQNSLKKIDSFLPATYLLFATIVCVCLYVLSLCLTLCNYTDYSPRDFSVHGIFQAIILDWVAISYSRRSNSGSNLCLLHWQVDSLPTVPPGTDRERKKQGVTEVSK